MFARSLIRFTRAFRVPQKLNWYQTKFFSVAQADIKSVQGNKPPMLEESVHGRYAGVLFQVASQKESLHLVLEDVRYLKDIYLQSESVRNFLSNTAFRRGDQTTIIDVLNQQRKLNDVTYNFLATLIENKRLDSLPKIVDKYIEYYRILNKEESITIISARELSQNDQERVNQALKQSHKGVNFTVKFSIDESILGGLQMYSGNRFMDASLLSRVNKIKSELARITL